MNGSFSIPIEGSPSTTRCDPTGLDEKQSGFILNQIVRYLPQYTLHNERHILNVLSLMFDWLSSRRYAESFGTSGMHLCILAAYVHDLGMALSDEEYGKLHDPANPEGEHYRRLP